MFCAKCGNELIEGTSFCPHCGNEIGNFEFLNATAPTEEKTDEKLPSSYIGWVLLFMIVGPIICLLAFGAMLGTGDDLNAFLVCAYATCVSIIVGIILAVKGIKRRNKKKVAFNRIMIVLGVLACILIFPQTIISPTTKSAIDNFEAVCNESLLIIETGLTEVGYIKNNSGSRDYIQASIDYAQLLALKGEMEGCLLAIQSAQAAVEIYYKPTTIAEVQYYKNACNRVEERMNRVGEIINSL